MQISYVLICPLYKSFTLSEGFLLIIRSTFSNKGQVPVKSVQS